MKNESKILIVDAELEFASEVHRCITQTICHAKIAQDKNQAQRMVIEERPDLIVIGTILPRGDAFNFHQWLKENKNLKDIPLLVIDASPDKKLTMGWNKYEGCVLEAEDYIQKPVDVKSLVQLLDKLIERATEKIKVLVADDHSVVREGIRILLSLQKDIQVVGEAIDGKEAIEKTLKLHPDIILMDIVMPGMNGLDATREICKVFKNAKVLMLTQFDDDENILASRQAGAVGFVPKKNASSELIASIRAVGRG